MFDPLHDPDDMLAALAASPPVTLQVPEHAWVQLVEAVNAGDHLLAGSVISSWSRPAGRDE